MQNGRNILTVTVIYFLGCALSIVALILVNSLVGLNFLDPGFLTGAVKYLFLPLIISIFVGYVISIASYQSQKKYVILSVFLALTILLILGTLYSSYTCEELGCIFTGFIYFALVMILVPFSASIPLFFPEIPIPIALILIIIITSIASATASVKTITTRTAQKAEIKKGQDIIKNRNIPKFDTNLQPFDTKQLVYEKVEEQDPSRLSRRPDTLKWLYDSGGYTVYQRYYKSADDRSYLYLDEYKPKKSFTDEEMYNNDLEDLTTYYQAYNSKRSIEEKSTLEQKNIGGYKGILIVQKWNDPELQIYRDGLIIKLRVSTSIQRGLYTSDQLIKLGESLFLANK